MGGLTGAAAAITRRAAGLQLVGAWQLLCLCRQAPAFADDVTCMTIFCLVQEKGTSHLTSHQHQQIQWPVNQHKFPAVAGSNHQLLTVLLCFLRPPDPAASMNCVGSLY